MEADSQEPVWMKKWVSNGMEVNWSKMRVTLALRANAAGKSELYDGDKLIPMEGDSCRWMRWVTGRKVWARPVWGAGPCCGSSPVTIIAAFPQRCHQITRCPPIRIKLIFIVLPRWYLTSKLSVWNPIWFSETKCKQSLGNFFVHLFQVVACINVLTIADS